MTGVLRLRPLTEQDLPQLQALLEADPGYARRVTGDTPRPTGAADLLASRPPGLPTGRKVVLGAYDDAGLAAVVDVLRGWPDPATAQLGLLQVRADRKRRGLGRRTHDLVVALLGGWPEITTLRAAIVGTNADAAEPFWGALGYRRTAGPKPHRAGVTVTRVTAWTRPARLPARATGGAVERSGRSSR